MHTTEHQISRYLQGLKLCKDYYASIYIPTLHEIENKHRSIPTKSNSRFLEIETGLNLQERLIY